MESAIISLLGVIIGYSIAFLGSFLNRKHKEKLFSLERKDKFRLIAIEKRLEAHQKAFSQWQKLISATHMPDENKRNEIISDAYNFWMNNSLYLENTTRKEFKVIVDIISFYKEKLKMRQVEDNPKQKEIFGEEIKTDWRRIQKLPEFIFKEVELEPINVVINDEDAFGKKLIN